MKSFFWYGLLFAVITVGHVAVGIQGWYRAEHPEPPSYSRGIEQLAVLQGVLALFMATLSTTFFVAWARSRRPPLLPPAGWVGAPPDWAATGPAPRR